MATEILLPQWGMEMQDGTIVKWLKREGDPIQEGEPLVEVETAKLETEMESTASGVVAQILVQEGATVPIRTVLAIIAASRGRGIAARCRCSGARGGGPGRGLGRSADRSRPFPAPGKQRRFRPCRRRGAWPASMGSTLPGSRARDPGAEF